MTRMATPPTEPVYSSVEEMEQLHDPYYYLWWDLIPPRYALDERGRLARPVVRLNEECRLVVHVSAETWRRAHYEAFKDYYDTAGADFTEPDWDNWHLEVPHWVTAVDRRDPGVPGQRGEKRLEYRRRGGWVSWWGPRYEHQRERERLGLVETPDWMRL